MKNRKIMKFDTGKKGFERATYFLILMAILVLSIGIYFVMSFIGQS